VEDFGILPVEVQAVGRPVVGVREGGLTESVVDGVTGVLYDGPGVPGLLDGIERMRETDFDEEAIRRHAGRFRRSSMERAVEEALSSCMTEAPGG
jgi:glycosyltransferase involved in cell wall biosynthesis